MSQRQISMSNIKFVIKLINNNRSQTFRPCIWSFSVRSWSRYNLKMKYINKVKKSLIVTI